ncbi:MAG: hypothetical protein LIP08_03310 [Bacteroides sp.]|nr:hypothetical protein [Bacteroides sp.]
MTSGSGYVKLTVRVNHSNLSNLKVMVDLNQVKMIAQDGYYSGTTQVAANSTVSYSISADGYATQSGIWLIRDSDDTRTVILTSNAPQLTITTTPAAVLYNGMTFYTSSTPIDTSKLNTYLAMPVRESPLTTNLNNFSAGETLYYHAVAYGYADIPGSIRLSSGNNSIFLAFRQDSPGIMV